MTVLVHCKRHIEIVETAKAEGRYVYIGRPSTWGNPFTVGEDGSRVEVIRMYKKWLDSLPHLVIKVEELRGKVLGCWCVGDPTMSSGSCSRCHGEVLLRYLGE